jgi:hypothetical protein
MMVSHTHTYKHMHTLTHKLKHTDTPLHAMVKDTDSFVQARIPLKVTLSDTRAH